MVKLSHDLLASAPRRAAVAHRIANPAAEMLHTLPRGATLTVEQPLGLEIVCLKGSLWITYDDDTIDHVLESGRTFTAKRDKRMLLHALNEARFVVEPNDA